jgi:hypothetical protein
MDKALATQLKRGLLFKKGSGRGSEEGYFANHYPHFGAIQCYSDDLADTLKLSAIAYNILT